MHFFLIGMWSDCCSGLCQGRLAYACNLHTCWFYTFECQKDQLFSTMRVYVCMRMWRCNWHFMWTIWIIHGGNSYKGNRCKQRTWDRKERYGCDICCHHVKSHVWVCLFGAQLCWGVGVLEPGRKGHHATDQQNGVKSFSHTHTTRTHTHMRWQQAECTILSPSLLWLCVTHTHTHTLTLTGLRSDRGVLLCSLCSQAPD